MITDNKIARYSYHYDDAFCFSKIETKIYNFILEMNPQFSREVVYICIGTDRATGDCLGPLVGTRLQSFSSSAKVYGTLEVPVHAVNLAETLTAIESAFENPLIIAVDACLGSADRVGYINVKQGSLKPGTALNKVLPSVGDFHISAVVNVGGFLDHLVLQNTRLHIVYRMADVIAKAAFLAHSRFERNRTTAYPGISLSSKI